MRACWSLVAYGGIVAACSSFGAASSSPPAASDAGIDGAEADEGGAGAAEGGEGGGGDERYAASVLADGPLAYFRFEDDPASPVVKSEVGASQGTLEGNARVGAPGAAGSALKLAAGDGVNFGQVFDFPGTAPFTLEAWALATTIDLNFRMLFNKEWRSDAGAQSEVLNVFVRDPGMGSPGMGIERYVGGTGVFVNAQMQAGAWVHVAAVYDGEELRLFHDGRLVGKESDTRPASPKPVGFYVGSAPYQQQGWIGSVDEVAIYDKALTAERVKAHFDARR